MNRKLVRNEDLDTDKLIKLWEACENWINKYQPSCEESIVQSDRVYINLYELGEAVCNIVGYADYEDEE